MTECKLNKLMEKSVENIRMNDEMRIALEQPKTFEGEKPERKMSQSALLSPVSRPYEKT